MAADRKPNNTSSFLRNLLDIKINKMEYIEVEKYKSTHTEITIGSHVNLYTNFVAKQYIGVNGKRRYLIEKFWCEQDAEYYPKCNCKEQYFECALIQNNKD